MPFLNSKGDFAHGRNRTGVFVNNVEVVAPPSENPCWYTDTMLVFQHEVEGATEAHLSYYDRETEVIAMASWFRGGAVFASGNGHWASYEPGVGIFTSFGWASTGTYLRDMGPDGAIAYEEAFGATAGTMRVHELAGTDWLLSASGATDVRLLGEGRAMWIESGAIKTKGLPALQVMSGALHAPEAVLINGRWWVSYLSDVVGRVIHPFDSLNGYNLGTQTIVDLQLIKGTVTLRFAWANSSDETTVSYRDIVTGELPTPPPGTPPPVIPPGVPTTPVEPTVPVAPPGTPGGPTIPGEPPPPPPPTIPGSGVTPQVPTVNPDGSRTLTSEASFGVVGASAEEVVTIDLDIAPMFPTASGYGRIIHPTLGAFDYEVKPDEWVNIDADAIVPPVWASSRTLTSAANVLWQGHLRDVTVEERWKALGGLAMPITQFRMLLAIWTTPIDPDVGYVHWYPNYITQVAFKVLPVSLSAGGQGVTFDDIVNYKDEDGEPIGWVSAPVTFQLKLVERL